MAYPKDVMDCLLEAGRGDIASKVARLVYQRAELLEALKLLLEDADTTCETYYIAEAAITKAEAAE